MNNSTETGHASMPLGIFASKLTPDVGIAMPTYFDLASKSVSHKTNTGGVGTPPYVATTSKERLTRIEFSEPKEFSFCILKSCKK